jgi:hypothetical protein
VSRRAGYPEVVHAGYTEFVHAGYAEVVQAFVPWESYFLIRSGQKYFGRANFSAELKFLSTFLA